jgi:hypothetical protein
VIDTTAGRPLARPSSGVSRRAGTPVARFFTAGSMVTRAPIVLCSLAASLAAWSPGVFGRDVRAPLPVPSASGFGATCTAPGGEPLTRNYSVSGRVRLLFFWTGRRRVGDATVSSAADERGTRRLELLIGTDPDHAPRRLNLWGYVEETVCPGGADLFGIMHSSADHQQTAGTPNETGDDPPGVTAIRTRQTGVHILTEILRMPAESDATVHDLGRVLDDLPAPSETRQAVVPRDADSGFLVALDRLLADTVREYARSGRVSPRGPRTYVYNGRLYELRLRQARRRSGGAADAAGGGGTLDGRFDVRNLATGETTPFSIEYGLSGRLAGVPIRIVYEPRWWLEVDLHLQDT